LTTIILTEYFSITSELTIANTKKIVRAVYASRQRPREPTDLSSCDHTQCRTSATQPGARAPQVACRRARRLSPGPPHATRFPQRAAQSTACFLRCGFRSSQQIGLKVYFGKHVAKKIQPQKNTTSEK